MILRKLVSIFLALVLALSMSIVAMAQDDAEEAAGLQLTLLQDGDLVEGQLSEDAPTLLFVFNANEGDEVTIEMNEIDESGIDPLLVLIGPSGQILAANDDVEEEDLNSVLEEIELPETGSYFIIASSYDYFVSNVFDVDDLAFELSIEGISEVEDMEDSFLFFADELEDGEAITAEVSEDQSAWFFTFDGEEGDVVNISAESDDFDTVIFVFGPLGSRVAVHDDVDLEGGDTNSFIEEFELPEDGTYLVMVGSPFMFYGGPDAADDEYFGEFDIELTFE
jgi:hypothetical protein